MISAQGSSVLLHIECLAVKASKLKVVILNAEPNHSAWILIFIQVLQDYHFNSCAHS